MLLLMLNCCPTKPIMMTMMMMVQIPKAPTVRIIRNLPLYSIHTSHYAHSLNQIHFHLNSIDSRILSCISCAICVWFSLREVYVLKKETFYETNIHYIKDCLFIILVDFSLKKLQWKHTLVLI